MTATAYAIACVAVLVFIAMSKRIEDLKAEQGDWKTLTGKLERSRDFYRATCDKSLRQQLALSGELRRTEAALVEAGREAATHADHLEALLEATSETPSLRLVRGQR